MANRKKLSSSNIRYLLTMKALEDKKGVRCIDMAAALGLSKPSVHNMMESLIEMGLVSKNSHGAAFFTDCGNDVASRYSRYYKAVSQLLEENFGDVGDIECATCALLSQVPGESLERLCERKEI